MSADIRVLLVDDEVTFVTNMARLLAFRGFDVHRAFNGPDALEAIRSEEFFDIVVLDIKMPGMSGLEALAEIKKLSPETEVIMLTGYATLDSGIQSIRDGAFDYLMKPCDVELLTEKIREACETERIRRRPVLWRRNLVKEITWPSFVKLSVDDPLEKALSVFIRSQGMPAKEFLYVLDAEDRFMGTVSRKELIDSVRKAHPSKVLEWRDLVENPALLPDLTLGDIMRCDYPVSTNPEENLTEAAHRMIENNIRCMPVVKEEKVVGFIRLQDIFQHVEREIA